MIARRWTGKNQFFCGGACVVSNKSDRLYQFLTLVAYIFGFTEYGLLLSSLDWQKAGGLAILIQGIQCALIFSGILLYFIVLFSDPGYLPTRKEVEEGICKQEILSRKSYIVDGQPPPKKNQKRSRASRRVSNSNPNSKNQKKSKPRGYSRDPKNLDEESLEMETASKDKIIQPNQIKLKKQLEKEKSSEDVSRPTTPLQTQNEPLSLPQLQTITRQYCTTCCIYRPIRSSHCPLCDKCCEVFDHHCIYIGKCIGRRNYYLFVSFVWSAAIGLLVLAGQVVWATAFGSKEDSRIRFEFGTGEKVGLWICFPVVIGVGLALFGFGIFHLYISSRGLTTREYAKLSKKKELEDQRIDPYTIFDRETHDCLCCCSRNNYDFSRKS